MENLADDDYYITDWNGEDIKEFNDSQDICISIREDYPEFRSITADEHDRLVKEQEEMNKEEEL